MRAFLLLLLLASTSQAVETPQQAAQPTQFVVGISPYLDKSVKNEIYRSLVRLLVQDLPLNSTVAVYDAFDLKSITKVNLPNARAFDSPKTRANQFAPAIRDLKQFLAEAHPKPSVSRLNFDGAIRLPQFCDFLAENLPNSNASLSLLLIGSPLYQDEKEPGFSMVDGYFPSDGHLQAPRDKSIFGTEDGIPASRPLVVHWVYFGDPWSSDLYKEKVTRFWTLYLARRGGQLVTFCGDLPTAVQAFRQGVADSPAWVRHWSVDPQQTKIEMLRIGREVELADWIQRDSIRESPTRAPSVMFGPMKIGIRWKDNIDLDLYAASHPGAETLFFQHPRSPEGYYYKDHRSSPGREYEFIEFETPVDIRQVEAFVNFYKGSSPNGPRGEVRIEFDGKIYSGRFSIPASEGNRGRAGATQQDFWTRIPIQEILKLSQTASAE
jgi:hypothetical protein